MARVSSDAILAQVELVQDGFPRVEGLAQELAGQAVRETAELIASSAKEKINTGPKTGRVYRRYRGRPDHQASAPGEAPAAELNALANSIQTVEVDALETDVVVGSRYGAALEFGRRDGSMEARPYMAPSADEARPHFEEAMERALREAAG